jgi:hypothetical protein
VKKQKRRSESRAVREKGVKKMKQMMAKAARADDNIIRMDVAGFEKYINASPRPYFVFTMLTALGSAQRCSVCHKLHDQIGNIASLYMRHMNEKGLNYWLHRDEEGNELPDFDNMNPEDEGARELPVFFVELDYGKNFELFQTFGLKSAPVNVLQPPRAISATPKVPKFLKRLAESHTYNIMGNKVSSDDIMSFIKRSTKREIDTTPPLDYVKLVIQFVTVVGLLVTVFALREKIILLRGYPMLFFGISLLVYIFCMSGGMFNIIRETSFFGYDDKREMIFFHPYVREQYGAGGYIVGVLNMLCALMMIAIASQADAASAADMKNSHFLKRLFGASLSLFMSPVVCLTFAVFCWHRIVAIYTSKMPQYNFGNVPWYGAA